MSDQTLSAADAALRERITELSVHIACGGLRGPLQRRSVAYPDLPVKWQSCKDEDNPQHWPGHDVSREFDLCIVCFRATAGGSTRWSWLACDNCRDINKSLKATGVQPLPLGRHSIMNGIAIGRGSDVQRQSERLSAFSRGHAGLRAWRGHEYPRLASIFDADADIPLKEWQAQWRPGPAASRDAFERLHR